MYKDTVHCTEKLHLYKCPLSVYIYINTNVFKASYYIPIMSIISCAWLDNSTFLISKITQRIQRILDSISIDSASVSMTGCFVILRKVRAIL